ncbi:hypothetical protein N799_03620 [Lysobacter arseniciresistens ZS79]|uniref:General secretion pathway protein GspM n=1 Tax=Lysobacter arseniciresistens ZS79 TaxID=913325 RepID=A0A0A0F1T0_9GAMM|nr:type II secretion system protein GspM [Lysobacter arseniciresistens]KGM56515.1 hypothetical protein N799_03620 [Lysobacter arseniciresistens ZS79]
MTTPHHRFRDRWDTFAPRERAMLALMAVAVAAFVLWLGVLRPLQARADAAVRDHRRAAADHAELAAAIRAIRELQADRPAITTGDAFTRAVLESATAAQVPVTRQRSDAGLLVIGIDAVAAPALFGWLDGLRNRHGIAPASLDIGKRNGSLRAEVAFQLPPP